MDGLLVFVDECVTLAVLDGECVPLAEREYDFVALGDFVVECVCLVVLVADGVPASCSDLVTLRDACADFVTECDSLGDDVTVCVSFADLDTDLETFALPLLAPTVLVGECVGLGLDVDECVSLAVRVVECDAFGVRVTEWESLAVDVADLDDLAVPVGDTVMWDVLVTLLETLAVPVPLTVGFALTVDDRLLCAVLVTDLVALGVLECDGAAAASCRSTLKQKGHTWGARGTWGGARQAHMGGGTRHVNEPISRGLSICPAPHRVAARHARWRTAAPPPASQTPREHPIASCRGVGEGKTPCGSHAVGVHRWVADNFPQAGPARVACVKTYPFSVDAASASIGTTAAATSSSFDARRLPSALAAATASASTSATQTVDFQLTGAMVQRTACLHATKTRSHAHQVTVASPRTHCYRATLPLANVQTGSARKRVCVATCHHSDKGLTEFGCG